MDSRLGVPEDAVTVVLYKIVREELIGCEPVTFTDGAPAIDTVLRRAKLSGRVEVGGEHENYFADLLDADQSMVATVALDAKSYGTLKNHWMRTRIDRHAD